MLVFIIYSILLYNTSNINNNNKDKDNNRKYIRIIRI